MTDTPENTPVSETIDNQSPGEKLNDLFIALQIQSRYIEELLVSLRNGTRSAEDFALRFDMYCHSLNDKLKFVKPLVEEVFKEGYSQISVDGFKRNWSSIGPSPKEVVLSEDSVEVVE
jgi:hypothetical protein